MKKKAKEIIVYSSLVSFLTFSLIVVITGRYSKGRNPVEESNSDWMNTLRNDVKLCDVVIPGSHDSGTTDMSYLGETQGYSIQEQLDIGVRYFDLRANLKNDKLVVFHSIINGQSFDDVVVTFRDFLMEHPSEVLILDAQHFKHKAEYRVRDLFIKELKNYGLVAEKDSEQSDLEYVSTVTLGDIRGQCLIFFGEDDQYGIAEETNWIMKRSYKSGSNANYSLESYYNKKEHCGSSKKFCQKTLPSYFDRAKEKEQRDGYKGLFVLQSQLTEGALIFGPWSRERGHDKNVSAFINNLPNQEYFSYTNVVMRDFVNESKVNDIIDLNINKGLLK